MYTGSNPSALRSMEWIRDALLSLLKEEKYEEITIKEICRRADLSRQTFYQLFASKEAVIQYHFATLFQAFEQERDAPQNNTVPDLVRHFFDFFHKHQEFIRILVSNNLTFLLEQQFEVYLQRIELFRAANGRENHGDYTTAFVAGALTQVLIHWFEQDFDLELDEISRLMVGTITGEYARRAALHAATGPAAGPDG